MTRSSFSGVFVESQAIAMSTANQIIEAANRVREGIDSLPWLQSSDAPHNFFDPTGALACPNMGVSIKRLFKDYHELSKLSPADLFPITRIEPALSIGSSAPAASLEEVPPSSHHLFSYWRVYFIAPRRPLIIDDVPQPPQVRVPCFYAPNKAPKSMHNAHSFQAPDSVVQPLLAEALASTQDIWRLLKGCKDAAALPGLRDEFIRRSRVRLPSYERVLAAHALRIGGGGCASDESIR